MPTLISTPLHWDLKPPCCIWTADQLCSLPMQAQNPMPRLVYASSSSVYGLNKKQPFSESDRVDTPASLYASTKRVRLPTPSLRRAALHAALGVSLAATVLQRC